MDAVRVCLLLVAELVFMGKEDRNCIPRHLVSLVEDFDCWNDYHWGEYMWVKFYKRTVNVAAKHRAFHLDKKKQNPDYYPTYNLYGFPLAFKIWILESYPNSRKWWSKKDNMLSRAFAWSNVTKFGKNDYNGLLGPPDGHNDNQMGIMIQSNSSGHEIPNVVVVVACMGIDKPDGHNDNPNANDNDVNKGIDPMSTCSGPDMHLAEVVVVGMEINKGDGHIDIPTTSDNDVNLAKSVSVNDPMPSTLNALIEGFDSQNNNPGIDFLQHDDHVDCSVAKPNDHPTANIGVKPIHVCPAKKRKKRLAMTLESPFGQQPPTTPIPPKRISRSVNCDFILPPDFEEKGRVKLRRVRAMFMTIQSNVKDKILATPSKTSEVENAPAEMLRDLDQQMEKRADDAMAMTIQYGVREMILEAQSEAFKQENVPLVGSEMDEAHASRAKERNSGDDSSLLRWMNLPRGFGRRCKSNFVKNIDEGTGFIDFGCSYHSSIWCAPFEALYGMKCRSPVLWAEIGESSLTGPELVLDNDINEGIIVKEKAQAARDLQKSKCR
ncbi:hypothetical protein Tco_0352716 [Tanacetum coccineum]